MVYYNVSSYNSDMFLVGIISWWYSNGFISRIRITIKRLRLSADFFSVGLLLSTLFAPFRQISADASGVSFADQIHAFFDKLLSRMIGFVVRLFMIIVSLIIMSLQIVFGAIILISWLIIPILPVVGLIATVIGWVPRWI